MFADLYRVLYEAKGTTQAEADRCELWAIAAMIGVEPQPTEWGLGAAAQAQQDAMLRLADET